MISVKKFNELNGRNILVLACALLSYHPQEIPESRLITKRFRYDSIKCVSYRTSPSHAAQEEKLKGKSVLDSVKPPSGRLAIVADGNSPDPDDIGATAVMFGLLKATKLQHRLVHLSHSCDLRPTDRISAKDELRRQKILDQVCQEGIKNFGPFKNLSRAFNCRVDQEKAIADLRDAINQSTAEDPLWIIEAGEPDMIGYALKAADGTKIKFTHIVSHHPANDNAGDFFTWQDILSYGINEHQIGDQNIELKTKISCWDWAKNHSNSDVVWIWNYLAYAEKDGVVKFQAHHFDCSDAGMVYWWMTGADMSGNKKAKPSDIAEVLKNGLMVRD